MRWMRPLHFSVEIKIAFLKCEHVVDAIYLNQRQKQVMKHG